MTKIITRYFENADKARAAKKDLLFIERFPPHIVHLFEGADDIATRLAKFDVDPGTADAYRQRLESGGAVLLVTAGYKPLGVAQITRDLTAMSGGPSIEGLNEEVTVRDDPQFAPSILDHHPLMMTNPREPGDTNYYQANWPIPLISRRKPFTHSLIEPHARMADIFWPLVIRYKPYSWKLFDEHAYMANWPIGHISKRKPWDAFAFPRHARMANFILPLLSKRKPYTKSLFPRHQRMATVPFPLLINGKTGGNALIPGAPRMANFPIPLLSNRKPYDEMAFPRHARMANFPIGLISKRKPFTGSIFSRHARMANFILPLVIKSSEPNRYGQPKKFLLSRLFGIPTLLPR